jgi:UDP-N-acetylglucosamine 2-epimerase (non-hydrolysing)
MQKLLAVVGTRPEAIKMAPLIKRLQQASGLSIAVCSTGQHREMVKQVFDLFGLASEFDLQVMEPNQRLSSLTGRVIAGMEDILLQYGPDRVLVHGDTTTTMAASLAAYYQKIPIGHVEAGLRTGNIYAPWPEEINRRISDVIADKLYAPTQAARENLLRENVPDANILVTGNTVIDALFDLLNGTLSDPKVTSVLKTRFEMLQSKKKTILVTCHRRESYGEGFSDICQAIAILARRDDVQIVFPIHPNPNVRVGFSALADLPNVRLLEPLDYLDFVYVMSQCHFVLTDSGGIQEEAPSLGKPVLVLREVTERPEAVSAGTVKLVGTDRNLIVHEATILLDNPGAYSAMSSIHNPYGDGKACERIIASLQNEQSNALYI